MNKIDVLSLIIPAVLSIICVVSQNWFMAGVFALVYVGMLVKAFGK